MVARPDDCCIRYNTRRVERRFGHQKTGARDKVHLQPGAIRILDKHVVKARRSVAFLRSADDGHRHLFERR